MGTLEIRAKAKQLGIEGYKAMSASELQDAIKNHGKSEKAAPAKKKGAAKKSAAPAKSVSKKSSAKKTAKKSAPAKAEKVAKKRGRPAGSKNVKKAVKVTKPKADGPSGRNLIDDKSIDWKAEWSGGQRGNRQTILKAVRKFRGNVDKCFELLKPDAQQLFKTSPTTGKKYTKAEAEALLRWNISRVKFDFVTGTGQHEASTNRKNTVSKAKKAASKPAAKRGRPKGSKSKAEPVAAKKAAKRGTAKPKKAVAKKKSK
jgi:hypothetical protein